MEGSYLSCIWHDPGKEEAECITQVPGSWEYVKYCPHLLFSSGKVEATPLAERATGWKVADIASLIWE